MKPNMESYEVYQTIGRGAFATCQLVRRKNDGRLLVLKKLSACIGEMTEAEKMDFDNEVKVLADLNHPNIIQYIGSFVNDGTHHIVMEYAGGGSLSTLIKSSQTHLPENQIWEIFSQICVALKYVHSQKILHRDIKPQNILLWGAERRVVKLADFGIAKVLHSGENLAATLVGTPYYLSPELCEGRSYDTKSDIWSLGCVLYEMVALKKPFSVSNIPALVLSITRGNYDELPSEAHKYPKAMLELIEKMLEVDSKKRPDIGTVCADQTVAHRINLWQAIQDRIVAVEAEKAQNDADEYLVSKRASVCSDKLLMELQAIPGSLNEEEEDESVQWYSTTTKSSKSSGGSSNGTNSSSNNGNGKKKRLRKKTASGGMSQFSARYSSLEKAMVGNNSMGHINASSSFGSPSSAGSTSSGSEVYYTGRSKRYSRTFSTRSSKSSGARLSSGLKSSSQSSGSGYSQISLNSLSDSDARIVFSRYLREISRTYRWGNGQRRPILDERLIGINIENIIQPRFFDEQVEHSHVLALGIDGEVLAWGSASDGRLGLGKQCKTTERQPRSIPYFMEREIRVTAIDCGNSHCAAVSFDGKLYLWGDIGNAGGIDGLQLKREAERMRDFNDLNNGNDRRVSTSSLPRFEVDGSESPPSPWEERGTPSPGVPVASTCSSNNNNNSGASPRNSIAFDNPPFSPRHASPRSSSCFSPVDDKFVEEEEHGDLNNWPEWAQVEARNSRLESIISNTSASPRNAPFEELPIQGPLLPGQTRENVILEEEVNIAMGGETNWPKWALEAAKVNEEDQDTESLINPFGFKPQPSTENPFATPTQVLKSSFVNPFMLPDGDEDDTKEKRNPFATHKLVDHESDKTENTTDEPYHDSILGADENIIQVDYDDDEEEEDDEEEQQEEQQQQGDEEVGSKEKEEEGGETFEEEQKETHTFPKKRSKFQQAFKKDLQHVTSLFSKKMFRTFSAASSPGIFSSRSKPSNLSVEVPTTVRKHRAASVGEATSPGFDKEAKSPRSPGKLITKVMSWVRSSGGSNRSNMDEQQQSCGSPASTMEEEKEKDELDPINKTSSFEVAINSGIPVGSRVHLYSKRLLDCAVVRFVGTTQFAPGIWVGLEMDNPLGKNDGSVNGVQYFQAGENRGLFVRPQTVRVVVPGEAFDFDDMDQSPSSPSSSPLLDQDQNSADGLFSEKTKRLISSPRFSIRSSFTSVLDDIDEKEELTQEGEDEDQLGALKEVSGQVARPPVDVTITRSDSESTQWLFYGIEDDPDLGDILYEPRLVFSLRDHYVIQVACGGAFTIVMTREGRLFSFGENDYGQLGVGDDDPRDTPTPVSLPMDHVVKAISAGEEHVLTIAGDGSMFSWGRGDEGQLGLGREVYDDPQPIPQPVFNIPSKVIAISAGRAHSCAIVEEGEVYTWGRGEEGQLGHSNFESLIEPAQVESLGRSGQDIQVVDVSCGSSHTVLITNNRNVYTFGTDQTTTQTSRRNPALVATPRAIESLVGASIHNICAGSFNTFAISRVENPQDGA